MNNSRGFTLLELLIGMTLLGFILALLFGGFRLAANSWNAVEERAERAADEQAGRAVVQRLVTYAQPLHWKLPTGPRLAFEGQPEALRLVAPLGGQIGLRVVELAVEPDDSPDPHGTPGAAVRIVLRHGSLRYDIEQFAESVRDQTGRPLLGGLREATFSYFGPEKRGDTAQWLGQWTNPEQFPALVRLHLVPRNAAPIDLDMVPMANGDRSATSRITAGPR
jgi:prepilin-type N-terminal cleavage/methylation domain-containing protein